MPCPMCDHTMQNLGTVGQKTYWCPRCGTLKMETTNFTESESPRWMRQLRDALHHELYTDFIEAVGKVTEELLPEKELYEGLKTFRDGRLPAAP